jgi:NAD(P)-dependent dehydrogenase (short-subunit alcohol dehydrogenase family)
MTHPLSAPEAFRLNALNGRCAIVTGGASGIGRATALALAAFGADVAVVDVDLPSAQEAASDAVRTGVRSRAYGVDLAHHDRLDELVEAVTSDLGTPSVLVNCAGIIGRPLLETTTEHWSTVLAVNLTAPFVLIRAVAGKMIAAGLPGSIVNVSSSSAFRAVSSGGPYGVSKAGLAALTRSAAWELGPHGTNVNTVVPGITRTRITESAFPEEGSLEMAVSSGPLANLLRRVSEPEDVANVVVFLCLPASRQITGQVIHTSAGAVV